MDKDVISSRFISISEFSEITSKLNINLPLLIALGVMPFPLEKLSTHLHELGGYYDRSLINKLEDIASSIQNNSTILELRNIVPRPIDYEKEQELGTLHESKQEPPLQIPSQNYKKIGLDADAIFAALKGISEAVVGAQRDLSTWIHWYIQLHERNHSPNKSFLLAEGYPRFGWGDISWEAHCIQEAMSDILENRTALKKPYKHFEEQFDSRWNEAINIVTKAVEWRQWTDPENSLTLSRVIGPISIKSSRALAKIQSQQEHWWTTLWNKRSLFLTKIKLLAIQSLIIALFAIGVGIGALGALGASYNWAYWWELIIACGVVFTVTMLHILKTQNASWTAFIAPWIWEVFTFSFLFMFLGHKHEFAIASGFHMYWWDYLLFSLRVALGQGLAVITPLSQKAIISVGVEGVLGIGFLVVGLSRLVSRWLPTPNIFDSDITVDDAKDYLNKNNL